MRKGKVAKQIFEDAVHKHCEDLGTGVYSALPNEMGQVLEEFQEECVKKGLCYQCFEDLQECSCKLRGKRWMT